LNGPYCWKYLARDGLPNDRLYHVNGIACDVAIQICKIDVERYK
jgi:hypothetical protein